MAASGRGWGYIISVDREGLFDEPVFEQTAEEMKASGYLGKCSRKQEHRVQRLVAGSRRRSRREPQAA